MKRAPERFTDRLEREFDNRLRIRWSNKLNEWHIEYKVARGQVVVGFYVSDFDDAAIRAKDGYQFLLAVRESDRMPCPKCGYTLKVPLMQSKEVRCEYCMLQGRDGRYSAVFFPLDGDSLIQYLRKLDPMRTYREGLHKQADAANERLLQQRERDFENKIQAATLDNYNRLVGIPQVGYTGKEFTSEKTA